MLWGQNISLLAKLPDRTVTELARRRTAAPIAVSRYVTSDMTLTDTPPAELQHALPELPALASELTRTLDAAEEPWHRP